MQRRELLKWTGATALTAASANILRAADNTARQAVVIGAGIVGASIAYHLAKRGVQVKLLEKTAPASGATGDSFAYLNASTKRPRLYYQLNDRGIAGWRRLEKELPGALPLKWGGAVYWRDEAKAAADLLENLRELRQWGYAGRRLDERALHALLPEATTGRVDAAVLFDEEGTVDPVGATRVLLERAKALGATLEFPVEVIGLDVAANRVRGVQTAAGRIEADVVIVAAGLGSPALINSVGVKLPLTSSIGVLAHTAPQPPLLRTAVFAPGSTLKQDPDGRIVTSSGHEGSALAPGNADQGRQILLSAAKYFPQLADAKIERVSIGQRVLPADGFPIQGFAGSFRNLYVAATHSGVTLAPVMGEFAAREIVDGEVVAALAAYRPGRFSD
jgi:glycine/D-amino acid oxidase-like deaminating enzyme